MAHQRPDSEGSFEHSDRDYENVIPRHLLRWQQPRPEQTQKAKPGAPSPTAITDHTECCSLRTSIVVLFLLVCASLVIATAAFVLALWNVFHQRK